MSDIEFTIPHADAVRAEVNAPVLIPLYAVDGRVIHVAPGDAESWLALGFQRSLFDPIAAAAALKALFPAAWHAIEQYVDGVLADGEIDAADDAAAATAQMAMQEIERAWGDLQRGLTQRYPMRQGAAVRMRDERGRETDVDPAQVAEFALKGWSIIE